MIRRKAKRNQFPTPSAQFVPPTMHLDSPACCSHGNLIPVESIVTGEVLARLCPDCDRQFPPTGLCLDSPTYDVVLS